LATLSLHDALPTSGRQVRLVTRDGEPWFVARDVCAVLGIRNVADSLAGLDDDERGVATTDTLGGEQQVSIVNESGLYSLIFRSRKSEAKAFKRWVTHEVLPSIRKNGGYISASATADQLDTLVKQAAVLQALNGLADKGWLDAKARILGARALGETPQLDQATKPLTVSIYLTRKGLKGRELKAAASMFGKRLKALFVESYGEEPPVIEDVVGRHVVNVAQYQDQHSFLFDRIWSKYYGGAA
jgi:prophage antirepressor-like protein